MAQVITTKYACPTNSTGSRIIVKSWMGRSVFSWDHALDSTENHLAAIDEHIAKKLADFPWKVLAVGENIESNGKTALIESVSGFENAVGATKWWENYYA